MEELITKFKEYLVKSKKTYVKQIMKDLNLKEYEVYGLVELLKQEGYLYDIQEGKIIKVKPFKESTIYKVPNNLDTIKLLLLSDTHLASKFDRLDILNYLYDKADKRGIDYVLHCGDVVDGNKHPAQLYELKETSFDGQVQYVIDKYPKSDIPTFMIAGNHDMFWYQKAGADPLKIISKERPDLHYLGSDCEDLVLGKTKIRMQHGAKGSAYARSYRAQKTLDSINPDERPFIYQTGHNHYAFYMLYGKTHCFQTSCLQDQTTFIKSLGLSNDKSVWWATIHTDNNGKPIMVEPELETFGDKLIRRKRGE